MERDRCDFPALRPGPRVLVPQNPAHGCGAHHCGLLGHCGHDARRYVHGPALRMEQDGLHLSGWYAGHVVHHHYLQGFRRYGLAAEAFRQSCAQCAHHRGHPGHRAHGDALYAGRQQGVRGLANAHVYPETRVLPRPLVCGGHLSHPAVPAQSEVADEQ